MKLKVLLFILPFFVLSQISCSAEKTYKRKALLMGTFVEIQVVPERGLTKEYLDDVIKSAFGEIRKVERIFNLYDPESELYRLNEEGIGQTYKVSNEFMFLLKESKRLYQITGGAFDISIAPLSDLWQNASEINKVPSDSEIKNVLNFIGINKVIIDEQNNTLTLREGMKLDFGAIAKGYAVDKVISLLETKGINNAIVNAGGDMYCLGRGLTDTGWRVGIRHPKRRNDFIATLLLRNRAVATSGSYERFYTIEKKRFSHILDPKTGKPVGEIPLSATVLADSCTTADGLATSVFVLGPEKGLKLLNSFGGVEGVIASESLGKLKIDISEGLKEIDIYDEK